jgi:membrane protein
MAYNETLALFPAILAIFTAIGLVKSSEQTLLEIANQLARVVPREVLTLIQNFIQEITHTRNQGLFSLSFVVSLWAASGAVSAAMSALDQIHQIPHTKIRPFWRAKLISLGLTLGTLLLLITASLLIFISGEGINFLAVHSGGLEPWVLIGWQLLSPPLALGIVVIAFAFIYRFGPSRWTKGTPIVPGALLAAVFWAILSGLFRFYVSRFGQYNKAYGAVGAVIVLLLWLYLCSLVLLIGAQLNFTVGKAMKLGKREANSKQ